MTSHLTTAQVVVAADPHMGRALNAVSRLRGKADHLEMAIAAQDERLRLRALLELADLVKELGDLLYPGRFE